MTVKAEGIWECQVLSGKAGADGGVPNVQINVQITEGPSAGQRCTYEDVVNASTAKYVGWSLSAVGYKGGSLKNLEGDIAEWIAKTGGKTTVEIKHVAVKRGKAYDKWVADGQQGPSPIWDKANGLGRGAAKPLAPLAGEALYDADAALRGFVSSGAPQDGAPPQDDDNPFISCASREPSPIAKVLR